MTSALRNHPLLRDRGARSWPPTWFWTGGKKIAAAGEVGILKDVKIHDALSTKCYLFVEHDGATFIGRLSVDSWDLCQEIVQFLRQHLGEPLRSIGALEVELTDIDMPIEDSNLTAA